MTKRESEDGRGSARALLGAPARACAPDSGGSGDGRAR
jgi:hypothetical protein